MGPYQPTVFVFLSMFLMLKHPDRLKHDLKSRNLETRTESIYMGLVGMLFPAGSQKDCFQPTS